MKSRALLPSLAVLLALVATTSARQLSSSFPNWLDDSALSPVAAYESVPSGDAVEELNRRLAAGTARLAYDGPSGYLRSVLAELRIPIESQIAVFAKDSAQMARINMRNPRTLFFNDSVAVGWVRGGFIEVAAQSPRHGVIFYVLDQAPDVPPQFTRNDGCLTCHYSYATSGVPGMLMRSVGEPAVNHTVPIEHRWGGWYVTGNAVPPMHRGNVDVDRLPETAAAPPRLTSFDAQFDTGGYLSRHSDVAALMLFEHQMHLMNLLTRIGWEARLEQPTLPLADAAREVVDYMVFVDEPLLEAPVSPSSGFVERFEAAGPRDRQSRSLRQMDLRTRLMRYPCSYMIYAPVFDALPPAAKEAIYRRLWQVLSGAATERDYSRLSVADRRAAIEILEETKSDLPAYFTASLSR